ncbi:MAG: hypothetical protein K2O24_07080 [Muribaculaceae bacterium]|nr:hypothetical protein [Muribaculaceae bacterium]
MKTYAIKGLMEFQALIPAGRSSIRIPFTGGSMSGYGVTPATFSTADPGLQHLIEASPDFRRGRITVLRCGSERPDGGPMQVEGAVITFSDPHEAREYLAERCGVERHRLRTRAAIAEAARENGVKFEA